MELRFVEGNFEHGKFKLQYREPTMPPPNMCGTGTFYGEWKDVPCVKEEPRTCSCGMSQTEKPFQVCVDGYSLNVYFCPQCGERLREAGEKKGREYGK
jgi:hypothetical protein